ncbi:MAG: signal peptidase II [Candidatus Nanopelagicales bacterium]
MADEVVIVPDTRSRPLLWMVVGVAAAIVVIDQITKAMAVEWLMGQPPVEIIGSWLRLLYAENTGAAFGIGTGFTWIFTAIAIVVAIVIVRTSRNLGSKAWAVALGGLLGGAVGNLIDRLVRDPGPGQGYVVDFIALPNFPVFNVADMAITCSAVLMIVLTLRGVEFAGRARA